MKTIHRDIENSLRAQGSYIQILLGPRQCGKSTLFAYLNEEFKEVSFDDLQIRNLANQDPALFLSQYQAPLILDETQYAPNIFPELKKIVDQLKRERLKSKDTKPIEVLYRLTGSNQILMDKQVKESLVGRAQYFYLNTLSVHEIKCALPDIEINNILFLGGWPELYVNRELSAIHYLNDYIHQYIEKDIVLSAGIQKQHEFHTVLGMLASRTGNFLNYSSIAQDSGIKSATVKEWVSVLERSYIVDLLQPYTSNLNKRLTKSPKLYFLDTGLAIRLQGWREQLPFMNSPLAGSMFETLVYAEIIKFINNFRKDWKVYVWHTKEGEEIDFIIETDKHEILAIDAKMGIHAVAAVQLPTSFKKQFPKVQQIILVSLSGKELYLSKECLQIPIVKLTDFLLQQ